MGGVWGVYGGVYGGSIRGEGGGSGQVSWWLIERRGAGGELLSVAAVQCGSFRLRPGLDAARASRQESTDWRVYYTILPILSLQYCQVIGIAATGKGLQDWDLASSPLALRRRRTPALGTSPPKKTPLRDA